jgi:hypothetical protein
MVKRTVGSGLAGIKRISISAFPCVGDVVKSTETRCAHSRWVAEGNLSLENRLEDRVLGNEQNERG